MSSGKAQYTQTTEEVNGEMVRRRQQEALQAQRRRQQEKAHKKFVSVANEIEQLDRRLQQAISRSDKTGEMLPDYKAPPIPQRVSLENVPSMNSDKEEITQAIDDARQAAALYLGSISGYESAVVVNKEQGEMMLSRRKEMARVWSELSVLAQQANEITQALRGLSLEQVLCAPEFPAQTTNPEELERLLGILSEWQAYNIALQKALLAANNRNTVISRLSHSTGENVNAKNAGSVLQQFDQLAVDRHRAALQRARTNALAKINIDIPEASLAFINLMVDSKQAQLFSTEQIERYVFKAGQQMTDARVAEQMMLDVPQFIESTPEALLDRWQLHTDYLQRIVQGFEPLTATLGRVQSALHLKAKEHLQYQLYKADLLARYGNDFVITEHNSELLALHKEKGVGYLILTELSEEGGMLSEWKMFKSGEHGLTDEDFSAVCTAWQAASDASCDGLSVESTELEKGSAQTLQRKKINQTKSIKMPW